jgi:cyclopropane fatty-acyl-phospholipid synthase-like methyltransferase
MKTEYSENGTDNQKSDEGYNLIIQKVIDYRTSKIFFVANYYDIFTLVADGDKDYKGLASEMGTDPRITKLLLDALVAMKFLGKRGANYYNTPVSDRYLVKGRPDYKGSNMKFQELLWDCLSTLRDVIKVGKPVVSLQELISKEKQEFTTEYVKAMDNIALAPAEAISKILDLSSVERMLDVGGGPGTYSVVFARANPDLKAIILDLPNTLKITREIIAQSDVNDRLSLLEGNYLTDDFGRDYDLVLMSHMTHNEGYKDNQLLFDKAYSALKAGGIVVMHDFLIDESKTAPLFSAVFSVSMSTFTKEGKTYTFEEYKSWMEKSGFTDIQRIDILEHSFNRSSIIIGKKK